MEGEEIGRNQKSLNGLAQYFNLEFLKNMDQGSPQLLSAYEAPSYLKTFVMYKNHMFIKK